MRRSLACVVLLSLLHGAPALAQAPRPSVPGIWPYPPKIKDAIVRTYKTVGSVKLDVHVLSPKSSNPANRAPAIVFFFGGGWAHGSPAQFEHQARHFAERGMVAMLADYRVKSRHQAKVVECVRDAKSFVRWVRQHANDLGVDPERIVVAGGSAGAHLAACAGLIDDLDESAEDAKVSSRPNALVLFNPPMILAPHESLQAGQLESVQTYRDQFGIDPRRISPIHHIHSGQPPIIIFHGREDKLVAYETVEIFVEATKKAGNRCELVGYEKAPHGFFNYRAAGNPAYESTLKRTEDFLTSLGYLK